ncbi:hypothetical protein ACO0QE_004422 [Hanseniaspora vineae]
MAPSSTKKSAIQPQNQSKKRKVVTVEEKCLIFQKILHAEHEIYSLKELETIVPRKSNGVIHSMIVKELIEHMSNEDMINVEKCGNVNVYYNFPFTQMQKEENMYQNLQSKKENLGKLITEWKTKTDYINSNKSEELDKLNEELKDEIERNKKLSADITKIEQQLKENNTTELQKELDEQSAKITRLKDNLEMILDYVLRKFPHIERDDFFTEVGITEDLLN